MRGERDKEKENRLQGDTERRKRRVYKERRNRLRRE